MESVLDPLGPWHGPVLFLGVLRGLAASSFIMSLTFMAPQSQEHWCARPASFSNWTTQEWLNISVPLEVSELGVVSRSRCHVHQWDGQDPEVIRSDARLWQGQSNGSSVPTSVPCTEWEFDSSFHTRTVLSEWNTVCGNQWMLGISQSILMFGFMLGNFVFSHLSDWCGRRPAIFAGTLLSLMSGVAVAFASSFSMFNAFRFLASTGHGGITNVAYTIAIECVAPRKRALISMLQEVGWVLGLIVLPGLAYLLTNWVHLQLAISAPLIIMLLVAYIMEESPRWLLVVGRFEAAEAVLHRIVKRNGLHVREIEKLVLESKEKVELEDKRNKSTILDLFRSWKIAIISISTHVQLAVVVLLYYDLIYKITDFGGSPFINFLLVALLEIPVILGAMVVINYLRRRVIYFILYVPSTVACLTLAFVPADMVWFQLALVMVGKFCVQCAYSVICVQVTECFPTVVRAVALGSALTASRVGAIVAPFFKDLGRVTHPWVPSVLDALLAVGSLLLALLLPETFRKPLPDSFSDVLRLHEKKEADCAAELESMGGGEENDNVL
uniref:Putative organic cation/carnitine transporter n=1 Tax=Ixodes scapularis TaxID=6945 RepID=A0A4D5S1P2_IXOSC